MDSGDDKLYQAKLKKDQKKATLFFSWQCKGTANVTLPQEIAGPNKALWRGDNGRPAISWGGIGGPLRFKLLFWGVVSGGMWLWEHRHRHRQILLLVDLLIDDR